MFIIRSSPARLGHGHQLLLAGQLMLVVLMIALSCARPIGATTAATDEQEANSNHNDNSDNSGKTTGSNEMDLDALADQQLLAKELPRQHFKLSTLTPTQSAYKRTLKALAAGSGHSQARLKEALRETKQRVLMGGQSGGLANGLANGTFGKLHSGLARQNKSSSAGSISSATLKKLLNQTLPKYANGSFSLSSPQNSTSAGAQKGSNFKFVFIQRAAANATNSLLKNKYLLTAAHAHTHHTQSNQRANGTNQSPQAPNQSSLAASVSKQLASSLLYSAANLIAGANLTAHSASLAPSLSALASLASESLRAPPPPPEGASQQSNDNSNNDLKRISTGPLNSTASASDTKNSDRHASSSASAAGRNKSAGAKQHGAKRPSKIYNLPVKFVANGQPNSVVFSAIKQHFATIRKLQSSGTSAGGGSSSTGSAAKKRRKQQQQQQQQQQHKRKGGNSRLIYLPLRYLSNARPNRIMSVKAAHKSNALSSLQ